MVQYTYFILRHCPLSMVFILDCSITAWASLLQPPHPQYTRTYKLPVWHCKLQQQRLAMPTIQQVQLFLPLIPMLTYRQHIQRCTQ